MANIVFTEYHTSDLGDYDDVSFYDKISNALCGGKQRYGEDLNDNGKRIAFEENNQENKIQKLYDDECKLSDRKDNYEEVLFPDNYYNTISSRSSQNLLENINENKSFLSLRSMNDNNLMESINICEYNKCPETIDSSYSSRTYIDPHCNKREEDFWKDENNYLFDPTEKCEGTIDDVLSEVGSTDSVDSSTYDFVHSWCDWLHSAQQYFDEEEGRLLKSLRKDHILDDDNLEVSKEINRIAYEARKIDVNSIPQSSWENFEDEETEKRRNKECDKIAHRHNAIYRRREEASIHQNIIERTITNPPPIVPQIIKAYSVAGQCHVIDLMSSRPKTFQSESTMVIWDRALKINSQRLFEKIEEGSFLPLELDRKKELLFLQELKKITHEATKLAKLYENSHSDIFDFISREEIIILYNYLLVFDEISLEPGVNNNGIKILEFTNRFVALHFNKISFLRQPLLVYSTLQMINNLLRGELKKIDCLLLWEFLEKTIFQCSDNEDLIEVFLRNKKSFDETVEYLNYSQIMALTTLPLVKMNPSRLKVSYMKEEFPLMK